ncbi:MAG TPA: hypothetical protein VFS21_38600 [Roseiflexaceae bacterium]|nr:hypothetical protein [Roseiflexaceae bacterium]
MTHSGQQLLIIITGPVGGGKSTAAAGLAQALRRPEQQAAVIDLDLVYGFVRQQDGYGEPLAWQRARLGAAALARGWFDAGMAAVVVDGEFFDQEELDALASPFPAHVVRCFYTLRLSYETALLRVQGDPTRGASKDPEFLRSLHAYFVQSLPFLEAASTVIDTDDLGSDEVVARLRALVGEQAGAAWR